MNEKASFHRTTVYLSKQHEDLLDYIVLRARRDYNVRVTKSDVIRKGIEVLARMKDNDRVVHFV